MRSCCLFRFASLLAFAVLQFPDAIHAQEPCESPAGRFTSIEGSVDVQSGEAQGWRAAKLDHRLCEGDTIRVGEHSRAAVYMVNEAVLRIDQSTTMRLLDVSEKKEERTVLNIIAGAFQSLSRQSRRLTVNTPYLNGMIEGTEFVVRVEDDRASLSVLEGRVLVSNAQGSLKVAPGESATAEAGKAPQLRSVVRPRDAVEWSLYYPPVLAALGGDAGDAGANVSPPLREALARARHGDSTAALQALDRVAETDRDASFYLQRAALLLSVGSVAEARADIDKALKRDPKAGLAYALSSIIHVVHNERKPALADAERAVSLSPTAAAKIALSYAQQADFRIEAARDTLLAAVQQHPGNALAWARLGELWLMLGERDKAREAAGKAASLAPDLARTQLVLGFAALAEFRNPEARAAFERAIALSSADPLAHLGLGLAKISDGDLGKGRQEIEVATGLDSNNALLRAYLGKAYFEEKRTPLDAQQYSIAKELDPNDPTAYLYDGILKQTLNRPVEALRDLETSAALNDNRAVYRGRLLLDKDRAARGTSSARAYNDLGFTQLGLREAGKSLAIDPSQESAHRFLSDTYRGVRRRETSRVSELLQAQMLQDVNINPVQPSFSETNLNIITRGGATEAGFNEFTPLFERNKAQLNATGVFGNHDTIGGEGVVSAVYDRFSLSAGAFHHDTDGWRDNHGIDHDIYNVFAQAAITPELNIQAEYRNRDSEFGDLEFDFFPGDFERNSRNTIDQETARAGLRYSPAQHSTFLLSYIHGDRTEGQQLPEEAGLSPSFATGEEDDAHQVESQYIFKHERFNVIAGFGYTRVETGINTDIAVGGVSEFLLTESLGVDDYRGYIYTNTRFPDAMTWTLGLSIADFAESGNITTIVPAFLLEETSPFKRDISKINPKVGLQWDVTRDLRLRAAYIEAVKQSLVANRTLEPTQVAGFNQFFDEADGSKSRRYGAGLDWQIIPQFAMGAEATWRDIDDPTLDTAVSPPVFVEDEADERLHQVYLYWTPLASLALRTGFSYDAYKKESDELSLRFNSEQPLEVETISVPVSASYFHPSGFFAGASVTFVDQDVEKIPLDSAGAAILNQGGDQFAVVDAAIGFRLPKRWGIVSLQVHNLFDEGFNYQDDSFREFSNEPTVGPYFPDRSVLGRITINF